MTPQEIAARLPELTGGPHDDATITALAQITAEAIRVLNHATRHAGTITEPATLYAITANLAAAGYALPQLFGQLTGWLDGETATGRLADDRGEPVQAATGPARSRLRAAAILAAELGATLAAAQAAAGHLKRPDGGEDQ
jgi:hypothetical protein